MFQLKSNSYNWVNSWTKVIVEYSGDLGLVADDLLLYGDAGFIGVISLQPNLTASCSAA